MTVISEIANVPVEYFSETRIRAGNVWRVQVNGQTTWDTIDQVVVCTGGVDIDSVSTNRYLKPADHDRMIKISASVVKGIRAVNSYVSSNEPTFANVPLDDIFVFYSGLADAAPNTNDNVRAVNLATLRTDLTSSSYSWSSSGSMSVDNAIYAGTCPSGDVTFLLPAGYMLQFRSRLIAQLTGINNARNGRAYLYYTINILIDDMQ